MASKAKWTSGLAKATDGKNDRKDAVWQKVLGGATTQKYRVLRKKSTDPRHITRARGGFDDVYDEGDYICAGCEALEMKTVLYTSKHKFDCGCGWPGFWGNVDGNVRGESDSDGVRIEILCNKCNGHLGHVFYNEGMQSIHKQSSNERHCVNSSSISFIPKGEVFRRVFNFALFVFNFALSQQNRPVLGSCLIIAITRRTAGKTFKESIKCTYKGGLVGGREECLIS